MTFWLHFQYWWKLMTFAYFWWHLNDFRIDFGFTYFGIELILVRMNFENDWIKELIFLLHVNDWMIKRMNVVNESSWLNERKNEYGV